MLRGLDDPWATTIGRLGVMGELSFVARAA
jgi:hypothetical protein